MRGGTLGKGGSGGAARGYGVTDNTHGCGSGRAAPFGAAFSSLAESETVVRAFQAGRRPAIVHSCEDDGSRIPWRPCNYHGPCDKTAQGKRTPEEAMATMCFLCRRWSVLMIQTWGGGFVLPHCDKSD